MTHELWDGCPHWSEEDEQAEEDDRAVCILACPLKNCRRMRRCRSDPPSTFKCPVARPRTSEENTKLLAALRYMLRQSVAEDDAGEEAVRMGDEARAESRARRRALAWERAMEGRGRERGGAGDAKNLLPRPGEGVRGADG